MYALQPNHAFPTTPKARWQTNQDCLDLIAISKSRPLTEPELDILASYSGMGTLAEVFAPRTPWAIAAHQELKERLSPQAYETMERSMLWAFFTPPDLARAMWEIAIQMGFSGGNCLSVSAGSGMFTMTQPTQIAEANHWTLIERDETCAQILQQLYPEAQVIDRGFHQVRLPEAYDLFIDNVPYGDVSLSEVDVTMSKPGRIHSHALWKGVHALRPGGIALVLITAAFVNNPLYEPARRRLMEQCDLESCSLLPREVFKDFANTEVCAALLVLKKRQTPRTLMADDVLSHVDYSYLPSGAEGLESFKARMEAAFGDDPDPMAATYTHCFCAHRNHYLGNGDSGPVNAYVSDHIDQRNTLNGGYLTRDTLVPGGRATVTARGTEYLGDRFYQYKFRNPYVPPTTRINIRLDLAHLDLANGTVVMADDAPHLIDRGIAYEIKEDVALYRDYALLVESAQSVFTGQITRSSLALTPERTQLNRRYDRFVATYGELRSRTIKKIFAEEPSYPMLLGLVDAKGNKALIFERNTVRMSEPPKPGCTLADAYYYYLNELGHVDLPRIIELCGQSREDVEFNLVIENLAMFDPDRNRWVDRSTFLSGDVVHRLTQHQRLIAALEASETQATLIEMGLPCTGITPAALFRILPHQMAYLKTVQPLLCVPGAGASAEVVVAAINACGINLADLEPDQKAALMANHIYVKLGAGWIPTEIYEEFLAYLLLPESQKSQAKTFSRHVTLHFNPLVREVKWEISNNLYWYDEHHKYETDVVPFGRIIQSLFELRYPRVTKIIDTPDGGEATVTDEGATEAARSIAIQVEQIFGQWIWADEARACALTERYNQQFNTQAEPCYTGAHLTLPGMTTAVTLRPYQKDVIMRSIMTPATLMAHVVGLGKTYSMIAAAMECRRLGLAHKPILAGMKSTLSDLAAAFRHLYPNAKVLVANEKNFSKKVRQEFLVKIATSDWDCVILSHEQLVEIKLDPQTVTAFLYEEIEMLQDYSDSLRGGGKLTKRIQKALARRKEKLEARIDKVTQTDAKKNSLLTWEQLGIDMLILDECQMAKNLGFNTSQQVKGINPGSDSIRALDVNMKCRRLLSQNGKVIFATGTPISNSISEVYTLMRHLDYQFIEARGLHLFDNWSTLFGDKSFKLELTSVGTFKMTERLSGFVNVPELMTLFRRFADIKTQAHAQLSRPMRRDITVAAEQTPTQADYLADLLTRTVAVEKRQVKPDEDNKLLICTDGRKAALDPRLVHNEAENDPNSKVNQAIVHLKYIYDLTTPKLGVQAVFCDLSTPNPRKVAIETADGSRRHVSERVFNVYEYIKNALVGLGIPESEVAFIHDYKSQARKQSLFEQVNAGEIRIVMGSTSKLGTGCNFQRRLIAMHHLDAPWRPSDMEQRDGRGERYGNDYNTVMIFRYVTQGVNGSAGFDSYLFQLLESKARAYAQVMSDGLSARTLTDDSDVSLSFAEVKAIASGNPDIQLKADLEANISRLEILEKLHRQKMADLAQRLVNAQEKVNRYPDEIAAYQRLAARYKTFPIAQLNYTWAGETYSGELAMGILYDIYRDFTRNKAPTLRQSIGPCDLLLTRAGVRTDAYLLFDAIALPIRLYATPERMAVALQDLLSQTVPKTLRRMGQDLAAAEAICQQKSDTTGVFPDWEALEECRAQLAAVNARLAPIQNESDDEADSNDAALPDPASPIINVGFGSMGFSQSPAAHSSTVPSDRVLALLQGAVAGLKPTWREEISSQFSERPDAARKIRFSRKKVLA